ncbi:PQQ-binding-like beta-propeller repeat protein [Actinoplanes sp. NPDC051346]|uniref:outer membrane protein assembly factor BamB family protein n=1 Tax=Actinoplanes sp. NPDC051346 TaxID=3155048 RepID=UPI0034327C34
MTVIELGLITDDGDRPVEPARRPLRRVDLRRLLVAAVAALCLLTLAGSALPVSHSPQRLWSIAFQDGGETFAMGSDQVYVLSSDTGKLTAYGARDGEVRWTNKQLIGVSWMSSVGSGMVLMPGANRTVEIDEPDGGQSSYEFPSETVALDEATGRQVWKLPGEANAVDNERVLLVERADDGVEMRTLHGVRLRDGARLWALPGAGTETLAVGSTLDPAAERLATVSKRGEVKVYNMADGRLVAGAVVPWLGQDGSNESYSQVILESRTLYVESVERGKGSLTAYDTETMRRKWRVEARSYGGFYPCGPVLCVNGPEGTSGYERDTGALRWKVPGGTNGLPLPGGMLVLSEDASDGISEERANIRNTLIDSATGKHVAELGIGTVVWDYSNPQSKPYLLARASQPVDRTSLGVVDPTGKVQLLGVMAPVLDDRCQVANALLACVTTDGRLTVTDVG